MVESLKSGVKNSNTSQADANSAATTEEVKVDDDADEISTDLGEVNLHSLNLNIFHLCQVNGDKNTIVTLTQRLMQDCLQ